MIKNDKPEIIKIEIERLIPYINNSRTHSDSQVAQIAASIREFGFTNPVLIDGECGIIAGHGRVLAARKLGMEVVPCIEISHLTPAQKKAYIIADNKLALNADWDNDLLALELGELQEADFDLSLIGFDADELSLIMQFESRCEAQESSTKEIDPDGYKMDHTCPRCGFEFDEKT